MTSIRPEDSRRRLRKNRNQEARRSESKFGQSRCEMRVRLAATRVRGSLFGRPSLLEAPTQKERTVVLTLMAGHSALLSVIVTDLEDVITPRCPRLDTVTGQKEQ